MNLAELSFLVMVVVLVAFYLIFIRPARQDQERQQQTVRDLKVGDDVVTTSGFFARIKDIQTPEQGDVRIVLDLGNGIIISALTSAIARPVSAEGTAEERSSESKEA